MRQPPLVVIGGRPGTGTTTLARLLAAELRAACLPLDAIVVPDGPHPPVDTTDSSR